MNSFYIVKDVIHIDKHIPELPIKDTLVVHIDIWEVQTKYKSVKWSVFKNTFVDFEENNIVIVGMNRMRTSQSRYDMVYSHIYKLRNYDTKIIIDEHPFTGEPWRLWYVYGFLFHTWLSGENSMALEGNWKNWFERKTNDCLIAPDKIPGIISNTSSDIDPLTTSFSTRTPDLFEDEKYIEVKKQAFKKYDTPRQIIAFMIKNLDLDITYDSYLKGGSIVLPDWGISRFMIEENKRRMGIYNAIVNHQRI